MNERTELMAALSYDPDTGLFCWLRRASPQRPAGSVAGTVDSYGYTKIRLAQKRHFAHRLAWLFVHGQWPVRMIDHINGDPSDNRLANLRECTSAENQQNQRLKASNNKWGVIGVSYQPDRNKWKAEISVGRKRTRIGYFSTPEEAGEAYRKAKAKLHTFAPELRP